MPVTYCDVFGFLWRSVQAMACFFDCFGIRNTNHRHHPRPQLLPDSPTSNSKVSSLFLIIWILFQDFTSFICFDFHKSSIDFILVDFSCFCLSFDCLIFLFWLISFHSLRLLLRKKRGKRFVSRRFLQPKVDYFFEFIFILILYFWRNLLILIVNSEIGAEREESVVKDRENETLVRRVGRFEVEEELVEEVRF